MPPLAALSLLLELGAPLALVPGRLGKLWVLSLDCFHVGVVLLMAIVFFYPLSGVAFASFFPLERALRFLPGRSAPPCPPPGPDP